MKEYTVLKEYDNFYLCVDEKGFKECFNKKIYKPNSEGKILVKIKTHECNNRTPRKVNEMWRYTSFSDKFRKKCKE